MIEGGSVLQEICVLYPVLIKNALLYEISVIWEVVTY